MFCFGGTILDPIVSIAVGIVEYHGLAGMCITIASIADMGLAIVSIAVGIVECHGIAIRRDISLGKHMGMYIRLFSP